MTNPRFLKPKFTTHVRYDLEDALVKMRPIYRSCMNCEYFIEKTEICKLANQRPPARIIAYGCEEWTDYDEIPF